MLLHPSAQNQWLRENVFDAYGNYLYCSSCIGTILHVSKDRLARLREIKVRQYQEPLRVMTKAQVVGQKLEEFVLHPGLETTQEEVASWWKTMSDSDEVQVKYPHERHGLAGKPSNKSKLAVRSAFLLFVDNNSHPNGRQAGSYSPQFYFTPKFTRIDPPKPGEKDFEMKTNASVVGVFNCSQEEAGEGTCSAFAAREWLKNFRPKVAIQPHRSDYCDTCKYLKEEISRHQAILKRLLQSGSSNEQEMRDVQASIQSSERDLHQHKDEASAARDFYNNMTSRCKADWQKITTLTSAENPSQETISELTVARHTFTLVVSADYQQCKLFPHWGRTEQPGSTYYQQKISYDVFGLVDHRDDSNFTWLFSETIGPKNTDHTIAFLLLYIEQVTSELPWLRRVCVFLGNAGSTNKNRYLFSWAMELVSSHMLDNLRFCFLVAGHTKFSPDRLFALAGNAYNRSDIFNEEELLAIYQGFGRACLEDGSNVRSWRKTLEKKYSDLPGVRKLHDFLTVRISDDEVVMKVRSNCHTGALGNSALRIINPSEVCSPNTSYLQQVKPISADKLAHVTQMCSKYIPPERWPRIIATSLQQPLPPLSTPTLGTSLPRDRPSASDPHHESPRHSSTPPPKRSKPLKCPTCGCDGTGHRNKKRWNEGHRTKAGCPRVPR